MKTKSGVTVAMLVIVILVLSILSATIITTVSKSIENTNLSVWTQEIAFVQDLINESKDKEAMLLNEMDFNVANISLQVLKEQFKDEEILNGSFKVYEINLAKLNITNTVFGKYDSPEDVYVYSKTTGRVYYLQGIKGAKSQIYYTLTDELKNKYNDQESVNGNLSTIVFNASSIKYTNVPVSVTVNIPNTYTNVSITTSNSNVIVGTKVEEKGKHVYLVNTQNYGANYTITVKYSDGAEKNINYQVDVYDDGAPVIESVVKTNDIVTIKASDVISGIKEARYILGDEPNNNVQEYFKTNGIVITNNTFKVGTNIQNVVVYVEDNAGNFTTKKI